jgi:hypothetical protein
MRYKIEEKPDRIDIEVSETRGRQDKLLEAFQECQQGRCSCPTREYSKLASLEIDNGDDAIRLKLKSRPGERFDSSEIGKCLEYTREKVMRGV